MPDTLPANLPLSFATTLAIPFDDAIARVTAALQAEGFGILTTIDVQATMRAKLNLDEAPYTILGACNPPLAHRAIAADPQVGLLLPCNVVVRAVPEGVRIEAINPLAMLAFFANDEIAAVAREAQTKLERAIAQLTA